MKKSKKIMLRVLPVIIMLMVVVLSGSVFADTVSGDLGMGDFNNMSGGSGITKVDNVAKNVWATVKLILQILAVAAIILAGVRYMFASADAKADIKKQTVILVVGAVIVFGASTLVDFIMSVVNDVVKTK